MSFYNILMSRETCNTFLINPTISTSSGFMMAHFEAKNNEITIESPKLVLSKAECW